MSLKIINKKEHVKVLHKHLEDAKNMAIELLNETYFPSEYYDKILYLKESLDSLCEFENWKIKEGYIDETIEIEEEDTMCSNCSGTGMGMYEGSHCSFCNGSGERKVI